MITKNALRPRFLVKATLALAGIMLLLVLAATAYLAAFLDRHKGMVEYAVSAALERETRITGAIGLQWSPFPSLAAEGVTIANAAWAGAPFLAEAGRAVLRLHLLPLLDRRLEISALVLQDAELHLEVADDGQQNWRISGGNGGTLENGFSWHIARLEAENARIDYRASKGVEREFAVERLDVKGLGTGLVSIDVRTAMNGVPASLAVTMERDAQRLRLREINAKAGTSDLAGEITLPIAGSSELQADLRSRSLNLNALLPSTKGRVRGRQELLDAELPFGLRAGRSGALQLEAGRLQVGDLDLEKVQLDARLVDGKLKLTVERGDDLTGSSLEIQPAGSEWQVIFKHAGKLDVAWMARLSDGDKGSPSVTLDAVLQGKGRSLSGLLGSANGHLFLEMGSGELTSDVAGVVPLGDVLFSLLNTVTKKDGIKARPKLECAVAQFDVTNGIAVSKKGLALRTGTTNVLGGGTFNLRTAEVDLQFRTAQRRLLNINILGVADEFVRIEGPLWEPRAKLNVGGVLTHGTAAVASGGATLLYNALFKQLTGTANPCDIVRDAVPAAD